MSGALDRNFLIIVFLISILFCLAPKQQTENLINVTMTYTETEILEQLDCAFDGIPDQYYPDGALNDIRYNFFPDLEHGYCATAANRIHLYADAERWAIVFEKTGYQNRRMLADIELIYFGNCVRYPVSRYLERNYITNLDSVLLIDTEEFARIGVKSEDGMDNFELISEDVGEIKVRDTVVSFDKNRGNYEKYRIHIRECDNPGRLIGFGDLVRYLSEVNPELVSATEEDIRRYIPSDMPKLMTIQEFYFVSAHEKNIPPSMQETYRLIAGVLTSKNTRAWQPTLKPNNHWSNWRSGDL